MYNSISFYIMKRVILIGPFVWIVIHYAIPYAYIKMCTPTGITGFVQSIFLINTPHCEAMRYVLSLSSFNVKYLLMLWATTALTFITEKYSVQKHEHQYTSRNKFD